MPRTLGKLSDFVTQAVASIAGAARDLAILQFADLVKKESNGEMVIPIALGTSSACIKAKGRVSTKNENAELFGLGGEIEEDQVEIEIEIKIDAYRLDPETLKIIQNTELADSEKLVVKHGLQKFYNIDESRWVDPDEE